MNGAAAVVLAAGCSSRMGKFKPLLPLNGTTVIAGAVNVFFEAGIRQVLVVTGHRAIELQPVLEGPGLSVVYNPDYRQGMFSSVRAGIAGLPSHLEAFFLLPADNPLVRPQTVKLLLNAWRKNKAGIVYPCFAGQRGHPPLISSEYIGEILSCSADGNLREVLARHEADALDVEVADRGVLLDMDTPEDYHRLLRRAAAIDIPDQMECEVIFRLAGTPSRVIAHGRAVASLASFLGACLNQCGYGLQLALIEAAGLLHDVRKGMPNHAAAGASLLASMGFPRVAGIVTCHMGDGLKTGVGIGEKELVYLADKLLCGENLVALEHRFMKSMKRFAAEPEVQQTVRERWRLAESIKKNVERVLEKRLDIWLKGWNRGVNKADVDLSGAAR
ncbi:DVU_1551 family NTP transferase [Desulfoscipio sp. XC116]|uniref:DVU_1551 family NTP transferase n=1 Tax=Desulfoscipio sp. XC116 TaxID=3144975 RepID=UPI00325C003E